MRTSVLSLFVVTLFSAPLAAQAPATICTDGSTSVASGRGACASHGGVDKKATKEARKAAKAAEKSAVKQARTTGAMLTCGDGSSSNPGRGACSHHGGVKVGAAVPAMPAVPATRATPAAPATPATAPRPTLPTPTPMSRATPPVAPSTASAGAASTTKASGKRDDNDPTGAAAQCKDGMYSHSTHRRGACSRHGGVAKWLTA